MRSKADTPPYWTEVYSQMRYGAPGRLRYYVDPMYAAPSADTVVGWKISRDVSRATATTRGFVMNTDSSFVSSIDEVKSMVEVMYAMAGY